MTDELVGIGALIAEFSDEYPDLTASKLRFLEAQGLLSPVRTPSGYRKYTIADRERLRYILAAQRDHFLPLRVISEHLDAMSRGMQPPPLADPTPRAPGVLDGVGDDERPVLPDVELTEGELLRESGLGAAQLADASALGLLRPDEDGRYRLPQLEAARAIAEFAEHGVDPRHLRAVRLAADRQLAFVEGVVSGVPGDASERRALAAELLVLARRLEGAVLAARLPSLFPSA